MASPLLDAQIVQATGDCHHPVREALLGIAEHVLDDPAPLDPRQGMLDADPNPGQFPIRTFLGFRQVALRGLFFGVYVRVPLGA